MALCCQDVMNNKTRLLESGLSPSYGVDLSKPINDLLMQILSYMMLITGVVGYAGNILNILAYINLGFSETINISFFTMAITDLLSLTFAMWNAICFIPAFANADLPFVMREMVFVTAGWPNEFILGITAFITAYISLERCLCVVFPLRVKTLLTRKTTVLVMIILSLISLASCIRYTGLRFKLLFNKDRNRTMLRVFEIRTPQAAALASAMKVYRSFVTFLFPLIVVIVCSTFLSYNLKKMTAWRRKHASVPQNANDKDGQKTSRKGGKELRVVKTVLATALVFIICALPLFARNLLSAIYTDYRILGPLMNIYRLHARICIFLYCVNSSANFFIFYNFSTKFRQVVLHMIRRKETVTH